MRIKLMQTASGTKYEEMMAATHDLHAEFCRRHSLEFETFVGVKRGFHPWQASFNRIAMLNDTLDEGTTDWVLWVDADAVIMKLDFAIRSYLAAHRESAYIAVSGTGLGRWDINNGVMIFNLRDARAQHVIRSWRENFERVVPLSLLEAVSAPWGEVPGGGGFPDDQHLLQSILMNDESLQDGMFIEQTSFLNYEHGSFIKQVLRTYEDAAHGNRNERIQLLVNESWAFSDRRPNDRAPSLVALACDQATPADGLFAPDGLAKICDVLFAPFSHAPNTIICLEDQAPVEALSAQVQLLQRYFPNSMIVGGGHQDHRGLNGGPFHFYPVILSSSEAAIDFAERFSAIRLVIDRGGGSAPTRWHRFLSLAGKLDRGGCYFIDLGDEDPAAGEAIAEAVLKAHAEWPDGDKVELLVARNEGVGIMSGSVRCLIGRRYGAPEEGARAIRAAEVLPTAEVAELESVEIHGDRSDESLPVEKAAQGLGGWLRRVFS